MGNGARLTTLSFGAGVQTTAMLVLIARRQLPRPDAILFADTGGEKPETYAYLSEVAGPYADKHGLTITTLGEEYRTKHYAADLETYCMEHRMLPGAWVRWCTDRYKVKALHRKQREMGATPARPIESWIGISTDEAKRATPSTYPPEVKRYPLIELGLSRADCEALIRDEGFTSAAEVWLLVLPLSKTRQVAADETAGAGSVCPCTGDGGER